MGEINLNPLFKTMPDHLDLDDDEIFGASPEETRKREHYGLPKHFKCSCEECAKWREQNHHRIMDLNWDMVDKRPEPVLRYKHTDVKVSDLEALVEEKYANGEYTKTKYETMKQRIRNGYGAY